MTAQHFLWTASASALTLAVGAGLAEHRRQRRKNLDSVGWMPWNFIQAMAGLVAILAFAYAMHV
ncbi:hypothetical protein IC614_01055 [Allosphingosinicella flava]|uniref:Uncharacterized protein n=1 Tax=Allosphingosinicella flava TaxID=2771430 RepID=A0A7T2LML9_9SPHN|nr:hypothetical protein [Sphingosinicella flava]QPQ55237.1 hypothetical protein IC614_01055 [Sphingosinicella flava]